MLDAKDGKQVYSERINDAIHRASPVIADGKIYLTSKNGKVCVVKTGNKAEILAKNELKDTFTASPAISDGVIYLRGWNSLYAIKAGD